MTDHTQLRKLAEAATPGPWVSTHHGVRVADEHFVCYVNLTTGKYETERDNRNFIAAANPQAVIELLDEIERLKKDAERYRWLRGPDFESTRYSRWKIEYWAGQNGWAPMQREQMDVAIDAAISKMESTALK